MDFKAQVYWEERLKSKFSLAGTGHCGFSERYNGYMYRRRKDVLDAALRNFCIEVRGKKVLDIGCGTGFFVNYYLGKKAAVVMGVDITEVSINQLRIKFPLQQFLKLDVGKEAIPLSEKFDVVNAFDVFYHIVDDKEFSYALENVNSCCAKNTWVLFTDCLNPELSEAVHVKYRNLGEYERILHRFNIDIIGVIPVFHLLGKTTAGNIKNLFIKRIIAKATDSIGWLVYMLDSIYCPKSSSSLNLLICRKK